MYERPACGDYQAQFRMVNNKGLDTVVAVERFMNNQGTYQLSADGKRLMRPQAGGYRLRFNLPDGSTPDDSLRVCIDAYKMSSRCVGCAAGGSDAIFGPTDIDLFCPYNNTANNDLIACYRRSSQEANWEAWIIDPRDCQPYRIVLMPDNKWWFARNLSYTNDLTNSGNANIGLNGSAAQTSIALWGNYWCPGGLTITSGGVQTNSYNQPAVANATTATGGLPACATYGALYTWNTAMRLNGRGMEHTPTKIGATSTTQGICPEGWFLPSDADWGVMLNAVEKCTNLATHAATAPCNHFFNDNSSSGWYGANAAANLKSTLSAPPHNKNVDITVATATLPAWPWRRADYQGKISTHVALGKDRYGFGLLPAGYRHPTPTTGFNNLGNAAYFWSSTVGSINAGATASIGVGYGTGTKGIYRKFDYQRPDVYRSADTQSLPKWSGFSVRCVRESLPAAAGITAPDNISYQSAAMSASFGRREGTWQYTWSVESKDIAKIASKVSFPSNGTSSSHSVSAALAFEQGDVNKTFTLKLTVSNGATTKTLTKTIAVAAVAVAINISSYPVKGDVTATASVKRGFPPFGR
ncbi:MAG: hypothetical protein LBF67_05555 [Prevotellaceae bacterium]|nr:hypothetical protein [Prevotellaceae bacterium]